MASSGQSSSSFGGGYRLQLEWELNSQNASSNTSSVTARLYLISDSSAYTIVSSTSKTFSITLDGVTTSTTGTVGLSGGQKKLLHTHTRTVSHNSNGTKSVSISGSAELGVTLAGTYYGSRSTSLTASLDTISQIPTTPNASTISSNINWRAPNDLAVSINRSSSQVSHVVRLYVGNTLIQEQSNIGATVTFTFDNSGRRVALYNEIGRAASATARVEVDSYYNGSKIGSTATKTGTVQAGIPSIPSYAPYSMTVGDSFTFSLDSTSIYYNHTLVVSIGGIEIARVDAPTSAETLTFNSGNYATAIHSAIRSRSQADMTFEFYTKHADQIIQSPVERSTWIKPNIVATAPTFTGNFTVAEYTSAVTSMLGSATTGTFISGRSSIRVTIPRASFATPGTGATISHYIIATGGKSVTVNTPSSGDINAYLFAVTGAGTRQLTVTAVDSRGLQATQSRNISFLQYSPPSVSVDSSRTNGFESETTVTFTNTISSVIYSGTARNSRVTQRYRVRSGNGSYGAYTNLTLNSAIQTRTLQLDNTVSHTIEYQVSDKLNTTTRTFTVSAGKPILFLDSDNLSVGINAFPLQGYSLVVGGSTLVDGTLRVAGASTLDGDVTMNGNLNLNGSIALPSDTSLGTSKLLSPTSSTFRIQSGSMSSRYIEIDTQSSVTYADITSGNTYFRFQSGVLAYDLRIPTSATGTSTSGGRITSESSGLRLYGASTAGYLELNASASAVAYLRTNRTRFEMDTRLTVPELTVKGDINMSSTSKFAGRIEFGVEPITSAVESGYCGLQTESSSTTNSTGIGYAVAFRTTKSYTPSSVSIARASGNVSNSNVYIGYITNEGFWFQFTRANLVGTNTAWRGRYTA